MSKNRLDGRGERNRTRLLGVYGVAVGIVLAIPVPNAAAQDRQERLRQMEQSDAPMVPFGGLQLAQAGEAIDFAIPAQDLNSAILAFADKAGVQVFYEAEKLRGLSTSGIQGAYTPEQALRMLLAGTGVSYRFTGPTTVTLERAVAESVTKLGTVTVTGTAESAIGPVAGYRATRSATGTKTDTPLIEIPQSISVITQDRLQDQNVRSLNQALRYTPGVQAEYTGVDSRLDFPSFRGFKGTSGNAIFRDGLQLRGAPYGQYSPVIYGAQRVEVLRGPSSALYGLGNPGGLINVITKRPMPIPFHEVWLDIGNFNRFAGKFDFSGPIGGNEDLLYRLTGVIRDSDTQVDFVPSDRQYIAPALTWLPNEDTKLTFLSLYQHDVTGSTNQAFPAAGTFKPNPHGKIPVNRFLGEPGFDLYKKTVYSFGYLFEYQPNAVWKFESKARYNHLDLDMKTVFGRGVEADQRTMTRSAFTASAQVGGISLDNHVQVKFTTGPLAHTLLFGASYQRLNYENALGLATASPIDIFNPVYGAAPIPAVPPFIDNRTDQEQIGLYAQEQLKLYEKWVLTLGGRESFVSTDRNNRLTGTTTHQDDRNFSGRAGLAYLFDFGLAPYVSYSQSFLPIVGTDFNGVPFEPMTGKQYEAGLKYQPSGWNSFITLAAYELTRENVLTPDPNNLQNQIQTGEMRSRGIELGAVASLDWGLNLIAAYTLQNVEVTKSNTGNEGNWPIQVPRQRASVWADYAVQGGLLRGLGFGVGVRYKGSTYGDQENTFKVPAFTLVDAVVHYNWHDVRFAINATNLLNNRHVSSCANASAGCRFGVARTVIGSIRYRW